MEDVYGGMKANRARFMAQYIARRWIKEDKWPVLNGKRFDLDSLLKELYRPSEDGPCLTLEQFEHVRQNMMDNMGDTRT